MSSHGGRQPDEDPAAGGTGAAPSGASDHASLPGEPVSLRFLPEEWDRLTRLPAQVMFAAASAEPDTPRRTVVEGLAGVDAIAGGRAFDSDLVRAVVAAIYPEPGEGGGEPEAAGPIAVEFADRARGIAGVLAGCRSAAAILAARADPADSTAYRQWLWSIAAQVCQAARSGGVLRVGGERLSDAERHFLDDLGTALGLT